MPSLKIPFDTNHTPITPTVVLANRDGNKLGVISKAYAFHVTDALSEIPTLSFKVTKRNNDEILPIWDEITNLKLVWCVEWDYWFEIQVELEDTNETIKSINATALAQAELSQTNLYDTQINTEDDIAREAYDLPTTIYNKNRPDASLLDRMLEKAPHYSIKHVDTTLEKIQRVFEFNGSSIKDCFNDVEEEIGALFAYGNHSAQELDPKWGKVPERTISLYDLESNCMTCGFRGEFTDVCPKCESNLIMDGYGEDTTIFISKDNLTDDVTFSTDVDSVKNCFRLVAGDDLMTATVRNCNPNGSNYIWFISAAMKHDMPKELVDKLEEYDKLYIYYQNEYQLKISEELINKYNALIKKYGEYNEDIKPLPFPLTGYTSLSHAYYDVVDFSLYIDHTLMPIPEFSDTTAQIEASHLNTGTLSPCAVAKTSTISKTTAELSVLALAKTLVRNTYKVEIGKTQYDDNTHTWTGNFNITNYSNEEDKATSEDAEVVINEDYERYVQQKIDNVLKTKSDENYDIASLFKSENFEEELKKYGLVSLQTFYQCCQGCLDVLTEYGVGTPGTWHELQLGDLYTKFYVNYSDKLAAIEKEIKVRESELDAVQELNDALSEERQKIHDALNMERFMGDRLWKVFCSYRREDQYENTNYISDGLSNGDLFRRADEFIESAQKDLYKSATMQHHLSATLKNLLVIKDFEKLLDYFEVGNWMRVECDGIVYKLRMISYEIDFDDLEYLNVEFSDVVNTVDGRTDIWSILSRADSVSSSYDSYRKRAEKGEDASTQMSTWRKYGLDTTLTRIVKGADNQDILWDEHGLLFREKDYVTDEFLPQQMKIINKTIAITDDAWKTLKTAIGNFYYVNPKTKTLQNGYGINGEIIIGKLLLGEELGIYNTNATLTFDEDGLKITNGKNTFTVNPNAGELLELQNSGEKIFWVDTQGMLHICGDGAGLDIESNNSVTGLESRLSLNEQGLDAEVKRAMNQEDSIKSEFKMRADAIELSVTEEKKRAEGVEETLNARITVTSDSITSEVERAKKKEEELNGQITSTSESLSSKIEQTAEKIESTVKAEQTRAQKAEGDLEGKITSTTESLQSQITQTASQITSTVEKNMKEVQDDLTTKLDTAKSEIDQRADKIELSVTAEQTRAQKAEGDEAARAKKEEEALKSEIELLPGKIQLSVSGSLGGKASITLSVTDTDASSSGSIDLSNVRQKFADDNSEITISAGKVTFGAGTFVVNATNFKVTADGTVTANAGVIGGCSIVNGKLQVPCAQITNLTVSTAQITGTLSADKIDVQNLSALSSNMGTITAGKIHSANYTYNSGNFSIAGMELDFSGNGYIRSKNFAVGTDGSAYFNGTLTSTDSSAVSKTTITGAKTQFFINNSELGYIAPGYYQNYSAYGIMFNLQTHAKFFAIEFPPVNSTERSIVFNNGLGNSYYTEDMTVRLSTCFKSKIIIDNNNIVNSSNDSGIIFRTSARIESPTSQQLYFHASNEANYVLCFGVAGGTWTLYPKTTGNLRLGCDQNRWYGIFLNNAPNLTSDRNKKNSITTLLSSRYEFLFTKLKPVSYRFNTGDRIHTGFISQDIEEAMDETGLTAMDWGAFCRDLKQGSENEYNYSLRYEEIIPLNTHMIQRTMGRVDGNTAMIQELTARIAALESLVKKQGGAYA